VSAITKIEASDPLADADGGALPVGRGRRFADVKSRIGWTAERRQLLQEMWERGNKAADIAAALGCKIGVVNAGKW
jgi:hypothetical protein